jgi:predicted esterase
VSELAVPATLDLEVVERRGPQERLLVLIHGYGESPAMLTDRIDQLDPGARCLTVAPHGPFDKKGRAIWHRALTAGSELAAAQYLASHRLLHELIDGCCDEFDLPRDTVIVGGFSQGAGLAVGLTLAPAGRPRPSACLAFCGFAPPVPGLEVDRRTPLDVALLLTAATTDEFLPLDASQQSAALLADLGAHVLFRQVGGGHELTDEAAELAGHWLGTVLAGDDVEGDIPVLDENPLADTLAGLWVDAGPA